MNIDFSLDPLAINLFKDEVLHVTNSSALKNTNIGSIVWHTFCLSATHEQIEKLISHKNKLVNFEQLEQALLDVNDFIFQLCQLDTVNAKNKTTYWIQEYPHFNQLVQDAYSALEEEILENKFKVPSKKEKSVKPIMNNK